MQHLKQTELAEQFSDLSSEAFQTICPPDLTEDARRIYYAEKAKRDTAIAKDIGKISKGMFSTDANATRQIKKIQALVAEGKSDRVVAKTLTKDGEQNFLSETPKWSKADIHEIVTFFSLDRSRPVGIRRLPYWLGVIGVNVLALPFSVSGSLEIVILGLALCISLLLLLTVKRLHNIGVSGWWSMLMLVPYVNLLTVIFFGVIPEQDFRDRPHADKQVPNDEANERQEPTVDTEHFRESQNLIVGCPNCKNSEAIPFLRRYEISPFSQFDVKEKWGFIRLAVRRMKCRQCGHSFIFDPAKAEDSAEKMG